MACLICSSFWINVLTKYTKYTFYAFLWKQNKKINKQILRQRSQKYVSGAYKDKKQTNLPLFSDIIKFTKQTKLHFAYENPHLLFCLLRSVVFLYSTLKRNQLKSLSICLWF